MQAVNNPDATVSTSSSFSAITFSSVHQVADHASIPDIEDVAKLPPKDALLPDLDEYCHHRSWLLRPCHSACKELLWLEVISNRQLNGHSNGCSSGQPSRQLKGLPSKQPSRPSKQLRRQLIEQSKMQPSYPVEAGGQGKAKALEIIELVEAAGKPRGQLKAAAQRCSC